MFLLKQDVTESTEMVSSKPLLLFLDLSIVECRIYGSQKNRLTINLE